MGVVPASVAVTSGFGLTFQDGDGGSAPIVPSTASLATGEYGEFYVTAPGSCSYLALDPDGGVIDFIDITGVPIAALAISGAISRAGVTRASFDAGTAGPSLELHVGDSISLTAVAEDSNDDVLDGTIGYAWTATWPTLVLSPDAGAREPGTTFTALYPGPATITVQAGSATRNLTISVADAGS